MQGHSTDLFGQPVQAGKVCQSCKTFKPLDQYYPRRINGRVLKQAYCRDCNAERRKKWYKDQGGEYRHRGSLRKYGLDRTAYDTMFAEQDGKCAICGKPETAKPPKGKSPVRRLSVDHNHTTLKVRGLLCLRCNHGIGSFGEDPAALRAAADYIEAHQSGR